MADAKRRQIDTIIGRTVLTITALWEEIKNRLIKTLLRTDLTAGQLIDAAEQLIREFEENVIQAFVDSDLAANSAGIQTVYAQLPELAKDVLENRGAGGPPSSVVTAAAGEGPIVDFPLINRANEILSQKGIVTREQFDLLAADARERAFTMARQSSLETIGRVRDLLFESIAQGTSLAVFENKLDEALITSPLGPGHLENVYRTNIQSAFHAAHEEMANDPIVAEVFPYQEYIAIHDGRVRDEHLALETLGLNGTNIYRLDDPFWQVFRPPWGYQCRCGVNLLTLEAAARRGVQEARRWERTGQAPLSPEWRLDAIPFRPDPEFVGGRP